VHTAAVAELLVVTGPPGAGKSTVASLVVQAFAPAALVPGDAFFAFWTRGAVPPWLPEAHEQNAVVLRAAGAAVGAYVAGGCSVIYDGVLGPWLLPEFAGAAGLDRLHYAVVLPPLSSCLDRVATRVGHGFDDLAAARHMHDEFVRAEVEERHVLRTTDEGPDEVARLLLQRCSQDALRVG
jgi:predicted ABC-type ATPase